MLFYVNRYTTKRMIEFKVFRVRRAILNKILYLFQFLSSHCQTQTAPMR